MSIAFPNVDPIILQLGPLAISWYSLSYVTGIIVGSYYCQWLISKFKLPINKQDFDDFISYLIIGIIIGGRLGYVFIYDPVKYLSNPIEILKTYEGGMSFHGGVIGVIISAFVFCKKRKIAFFLLTDLLAAAVPIGITFGRIANFINCELLGRMSDFAFAVKFPPDFIPRHASQIYESLTEGVLTFIILYHCIIKYKLITLRIKTSALFLILYASFRIFCECFRQPDDQIGFILQNLIAIDLTMGQLLSLPILVCGIILLWISSKKS